MAYYCLITDVTRTHMAGFRVDYGVMDDSVTPNAMIDTGSVGLVFDTSGTPAERRAAAKAALIEVFQQTLGQLTAGDSDFDPIRAALVGVRYPAA